MERKLIINDNGDVLTAENSPDKARPITCPFSPLVMGTVATAGICNQDCAAFKIIFETEKMEKRLITCGACKFIVGELMKDPNKRQ